MREVTVLVCVRTSPAAQTITSCAARLGVSASVRTAVSEAEALARLAERPADVVLADTAVTRPDSVGFTRRVLARAPNATLVLFGQEDPRVAAAAVSAGARGVLRRTDQDLVSMVAKALLLLLPTGLSGAARPAAAPGRPGVPGAGATGRPGGPGTGGYGPGAGTPGRPGVPGGGAPGRPGAPGAGAPGRPGSPGAGGRGPGGPGAGGPGAGGYAAEGPGGPGVGGGYGPEGPGGLGAGGSGAGGYGAEGADGAGGGYGAEGPGRGGYGVAGAGPGGSGQSRQAPASGTGPVSGVVPSPDMSPHSGAGVPDAGSQVVPAQRGDLPGYPSHPGHTHPGDAHPGSAAPGVPPRRVTLTERELQVLRGMADGKSNAEIGRELFVSEDTVKTHARRLFRKLGARDRAHAVAAGFRAGLVA